jgi:hypothetical protein
MKIDWPKKQLGSKRDVGALSPEEFAEQEFSYMLYRFLMLRHDLNKMRVITRLRLWLDYFESELKEEG